MLKPGGRLVVADGFRHRRPLSPAYERLLRNWLSGWAVPDLMTADEFTGAARQVGFAHLHLDDVTANVRPSLRRLYRLALVLYPTGVVFLRPLRLIADKQLANARSALKQYQALRRDLWFYGIVTAAAPLEPESVATHSGPPASTILRWAGKDGVETHRAILRMGFFGGAISQKAGEWFKLPRHG